VGRILSGISVLIKVVSREHFVPKKPNFAKENIFGKVLASGYVEIK